MYLQQNFTVNVLLCFGLNDDEIYTSDGYHPVSLFFLYFDRKNVQVDLLQLFAIKNDNQKLFDALQNATK